ncbi:hypothetical protein AAC387_Pa02g3469 [Persea americana]
MKAMETLQDLTEEAKARTLWWAICIFGIAYFLSHTSKSMWTNIPIAFLMLSALRLLSHEVEFRWKDFMVDLWYSEITPDKEAPDQVHMLIKGVIGEISGRVKQINLIDLLTRDMVDLIGPSEAYGRGLGCCLKTKRG